MALFDTLRLVSYATVLVFSIIVLGMSGHFVTLLQLGFFIEYVSASLCSLAVSVITWGTMLPILLVSAFRRGSFLSWVAVELGTCGLLWVLWLVDLAVIRVCRQHWAVQAFSWLNWVILSAYITWVVVLAVKAKSKGQSVWTMEIRDLSTAASGPTADEANNAASNNEDKTAQPDHYQQPQQNYQSAQQYPHGVPEV
ncbi:hypothetical protein RHS04_03473 [Rhizoctonia solani]|uniref:MARVEL domain-containing protein n=1 Tax=Rhizoctonia solani TaxID=456999 RepID=A0A8H7LIK4_9AGAM|nr:hypothetical protein RHS04_03473 [Rhizoctonia solani]